MKRTQKNSELLCTAVPGCTRPALVISHETHNGLRCRICGMHLMRERRGSDIGGKDPRIGTANPAMDKKAKAALLKLELFIGSGKGELVNPAQGVAMIDCGMGRVVRYSTSEVHALQRRGWVSLSPWRKAGYRIIKITKEGHKSCPPRPQQTFKPRLPHP